MEGSVLDAEATVVNKTDKNSCSHGECTLAGSGEEVIK
jgi:hypothetical protein